MKDNRTLEQKYRDMKLQEVSDLYYGSDKARDTYAKDTPGQTPGVDHNPDFQKHDPQLAVDGVPEKGGMIKKPVVSKAIKKDASPVKFKSVIAEIADAIDENMSPEQRKKAAAKIFQMHQDKKASQALSKPKSKAAVQARRDAASYKTSDDSHLDSKPKAPEKKRGRGEKDLPHIVSQLRGVVDTAKGVPSKVKFKDGTTKSVKPKHAASWLKKHDAAKPAEKLKMYDSHKDKATFKQYAKEDFVVEAHKSEDGPNCGCGKKPCETYGNDPLMPKGEVAKNMNEMKDKCGPGEYWCNKDQKCKPIPKGMKVDKDGILMKEDNLEEAPRRAYDRSSKGRAYRRLSDEEKARLMKKNELMRAARRMRAQAADDYESRGKMRKPTIGGAKSVYRGRKTTREQMESIITGLELRFLTEEKMAGVEYYPRMKKHGKMSDAQKKAVTAVYDKKPVDKKMAGDPQVKRAQRYMKVEQAVTNRLKEMKGMGDHSMTGMDPNDAPKPGEAAKDRASARKLMKHDLKKGRDVSKTNYYSVDARKRYQKKFGKKFGESIDQAKPSDWDKANRQLRKEKEKKKHQSYQKGGKNDPRGMGSVLAMGEATYDQVLKHRYQSDHPADNPQRSAYLGRHKSSGLDTYKPIPGSSADSKKGKMAAIKKQLKRRPKQYGITGKHDPLYKQKQGSVQLKPARQKSKRTAGQYMDQRKGENLAGNIKKEEVVNELYPSQNTGTIDMDKNRTAKQKKAAADHAKKRDDFEKKYPGASTGEKMFAKLSSDRKNPKISFKSPYRPLGVGKKGKKHPPGGATNSYEEVQVNELSRRTLTNYIQKAANPVGKKSAITYASKGAYKLGKSDKYDLDAGEKDDRKAFKRGKGIMRAAQKIQRKTYGNMTKPTPYGGSEMSKSLTRKTKSEAVDEKDVKGLKKLAKGLKGSSKAHLDQMKKLNKMISDSYIAEKSIPNNPKLWAAKKAAAKAKFDVYPSAYANGWAAKQYKAAGGTWRSAK